MEPFISSKSHCRKKAQKKYLASEEVPKAYLRSKDVPKTFSGCCFLLKVKQKRWYKNGKIHREDGPAIIHSDGSEEWCYEGKKHRIGGKAWAENYFIHGRLFMKKEYEAHPLMIAYNIQKKVENIGLF